jgi:hypothetical protein
VFDLLFILHILLFVMLLLHNGHTVKNTPTKYTLYISRSIVL